MAKGSLLKVNVLFLKMWSIYPPNDNANFFLLIADKLYKYIAVASLYCVMIPCAYELFLWEKTKITDYTLNIMNTGAYICSILTLHFFHTKGKIGHELVTELNSFKYSSDAGVSEISMEPMDKFTRKLTIGFFSLLNTGVISMTLVPLLMKGRILPIPGVFPFKWTETPYYQLVYGLQASAQMIIGSVTSSSDAFFISMVLLAAEQFKVQAVDFRNCFYSTLLEFGISKDAVLNFKDNLSQSSDVNLFRTTEETASLGIDNFKKPNTEILDKSSEQLRLMEVISSKRFERKLMELLINYIKHHQTLLNFCAKMEDFFWPLIFMKAAISMFYHIFITFAMVSSTEASLAITLAQYEFCAIAELFVFAAAGQTLINESENLRQALYESPWYFCNKQYNMSIKMILMRCARYSRVSVGKILDMSLPTFIVIMKTALSYLAVLRQVTE